LTPPPERGDYKKVESIGKGEGLRALAALLVTFTPAFAFAQETQAEQKSGPQYWPAAQTDRPPAETKPDATTKLDVRSAPPILAYTYTAWGSGAKTVGAQGYASGLVASGQDATIGGGGTVWGSPIDRLTLIGDAQRNVWGNFSPSFAIVGRILGKPDDGWSLGALGKVKIDGFASGPNKDEVESEIEIGALTSFSKRAYHLDMNILLGRGLGDDGETDTEARLRFGYDLGKLFRLGLDNQARLRIGGPKYLPNGKTWDFASGAQFMVGSSNFYGALTAGPATMGLVSENVGFSSVLTIGGTT
jgi:hypothetical protein